MPVLYVNGNEDAHFSVNATSDSACVTQNSAISFHHALPHSQSAGDSVQQVYRYAQNMFNDYVKNGKSLIDACMECGFCESKCPQHLKIRENVEKIGKLFAK